MKCPFCGSDRGYYQIERVHRALLLILTVNRSGEQKMLQIMQDAGNSVSIVTRYFQGSYLSE